MKYSINYTKFPVLLFIIQVLLLIHMENKEVKHSSHVDEIKHDEQKKSVTRSSSNGIPAAIVISAVILGGAYLLSKRMPADQSSTGKTKSAVALAGVNETKFKECFDSKRTKVQIDADVASADRAMAHIPADQGRGTPYSVAMTKGGTKVEIAGAYPIEAVKGIIDNLLSGKATNQADINLDPVSPDDHYFGSKDAEVVIVEYSDLECPYCAKFHDTLHQLVTDYNGKVAWVYRHLPLTQIHATAEDKALASECVAELGGNDAFWKYIDNIFEKTKPQKPVFDPLKSE